MFRKKKDSSVEAGPTPEPEKKARTKQKTAKEPPGDSPGSSDPPPRPSKYGKPLKRIIIGALIIALLAGGGFAGYSFFLKKEPGRHYVEKSLAHVKLPPEMMKFCFKDLPDLYDIFQEFNHGMTRLDLEIQRIEAIAAAYPEQAAIADKEKKIWTTARTRALQNFEKIERKVRQIYVTFQVNPETGQARLDQERLELVQQTTETLAPVQALTQRIKTFEQPSDQGWVKNNILKIKNLFD